VDARKSLFVTGDVNIGRDPSNVNVWGNMTLTGIIDLTAGQDPDPALLLLLQEQTQTDGTGTANGTLNVTVNGTQAAATVTLRRSLQDAAGGVLGPSNRTTNQTNCTQSSLVLTNGTSVNGVVCGTAEAYEFVPDTVDYFRRGRRTMVRPPIEAIPAVVPGTTVGRLVTSRTDLDIQSAYDSDITLTPGLGGRVLVHSETEYALRAGASSMRATNDLINISTAGRTSMYSGEDIDITTPNVDLWCVGFAVEI
jgi:hypothetical protein